MNSPTPLAQDANARGMAALRSGDAVAARTAFGEAVTLDPDAGPLWRNLAHACRLANDSDGERHALDRALSLDRTDFAAQLRLAQLLQRTGAEQAAFLAWNGALELAENQAVTPGVVAELDEGRAFCANVRDRIEKAASRSIGSEDGKYDETERRRLRAFVGHATGVRRAYANECAGVFYPFLPADEFFDRRHFPSFELLESSSAVIREELKALLSSPVDGALRPYVQLEKGTATNTWSALDGSLDWSACFLWEYGRPNDAVIARCPRTAEIVERLPLARIPGRAPNVFFSLLDAQSEIPPHTGVTNTRAIVHLALDVPENCGFRVGNETREWIEGRAFAFDDTIEHEAWNRSDRKRAVLILDYWNPHLTAAECAAVARYFEAADAIFD